MKRLYGVLASLAGAMVVFAADAGAAGVEMRPVQAPAEKVIVAQEKIEEVGLQVEASCEGRTVLFSFLNLGDAWPALATIKIFKVSDKSVLYERSMRMIKLQKGSFKLQAEKNPGGEIGFFVEPSWSQRPFTVDAKATCN